MAGSVLWTDEAKSLPPPRAKSSPLTRRSITPRVSTSATGATTNRAEGFFSQLKRSLDGTHHHVSHEHLHRYVGRVRLPLLHVQGVRGGKNGGGCGPCRWTATHLQAVSPCLVTYYGEPLTIGDLSSHSDRPLYEIRRVHTHESQPHTDLLAVKSWNDVVRVRMWQELHRWMHQWPVYELRLPTKEGFS